MALADLDNDGFLDLVVVNDGADHSVYRNLGNDGVGAWQPFDDTDVIALTNTTAATGVAVGDLTRDGYADVVVAVDGDAPQLFVNNGSKADDGINTAPFGWQGLASGTDLAASPATPGGTSVAIGDVTGDGAPDVVLGTAVAPYLFVNNGTSGGTWNGMRIGQAMVGTAAVSVALANVDGDSDLDVVLGGSGAQAQLLTNVSVPVTILGFSGVSVTFSDVGVTDGQGDSSCCPAASPGRSPARQLPGSPASAPTSASGCASTAARRRSTRQ